MAQSPHMETNSYIDSEGYQYSQQPLGHNAQTSLPKMVFIVGNVLLYVAYTICIAQCKHRIQMNETEF